MHPSLASIGLQSIHSDNFTFKPYYGYTEGLLVRMTVTLIVCLINPLNAEFNSICHLLACSPL